MVADSPFLITPEVAARLRCSVRTVHELTRLGLIPHRRLPGSRRCLFRKEELEAWEAGAILETIEFGAQRASSPAGGYSSKGWLTRPRLQWDL
jgi:excisionase family DNA binding protein